MTNAEKAFDISAFGLRPSAFGILKAWEAAVGHRLDHRSKA
jgi:hypothetical protein